MAETSASEPPSIRHAFFVGLSRPSLLALATSLAVTLALFAALSQISAKQVQRFAGWLGSGNGSQTLDVYLVTSRALELSTSDTRRPGIVLLGGSTTRESLNEQLAHELLGSSPANPRFTDLSGSGQSIIESVELADSIPAGFHGIVVLGVNTIRLAKAISSASFNHPRYGVYSPSLANEARRGGWKPGPVTGYYAVDHSAFLLRIWGDMTSNLRALLRHNGIPKRHYYYGTSPLEEARLKSHFRLVHQELSNYDASAQSNVEVIARMIARLRDQGVRLVLLEAPVNPRFVTESMGPDAYARHTETVRHLAAREGVPYLDFNRASDIRAESFHDWAHLRDPAAADRLTCMLIDGLQSLLQEAEQSR